MFSIDRLKTKKTVKSRRWIKSNSTDLVITFLVIILFLLYIPLFLGFQAANIDGFLIKNFKDLSLLAQIWYFLSSQGFYWVTFAFLIPIFTLFINDRLKFKERMEERLQKREEEKKGVIYDGINKTQEIWEDINNLGSEIRYYNGEIPIENINFELDAFSIKMREIKNIWHFVFNDLKHYETTIDYLDLLEKPLYVFYSAISTVARQIHNKSVMDRINKKGIPRQNQMDKELIKDQYTLGIIQTTINNVFYFSILNILKNYVDKKFGETKETKDDASRKIKGHLDYMEWLYNELIKIEKDYNKVFSFMYYEDNLNCQMQNPKNRNKCMERRGKIQDSFQYNEDWLRYEYQRNEELKNDELMKSPKFKELFNLHSYIGGQKRIYAISPPYSPECMEELAKYLDFQDVKRDLKKRAEWMIFDHYFEKNKFSLNYPFIWREDDIENAFETHRNVSDILSRVISKNPSDEEDRRKYKFLSYKNLLCGYIGNIKSSSNSISYKSEYTRFAFKFRGKGKQKFYKEICKDLQGRLGNCEKSSQNDIVGFRAAFICKDKKVNKKDDREKNDPQIPLPAFRDRKLLVIDNKAYFIELIVSQSYYEENEKIIDKTMDSFKLDSA